MVWKNVLDAKLMAENTSSVAYAALLCQKNQINIPSMKIIKSTLQLLQLIGEKDWVFISSFIFLVEIATINDIKNKIQI